MSETLTVKRPKYAALTPQQVIDARLNYFAAQLLAESYGDDPDRFKGESILISAPTHKGKPVYILIMDGPESFVGVEPSAASGPRLGMCDKRQYEHSGPHAKIADHGQSLPPFPCVNWHEVIEPGEVSDAQAT